MFDHSTIFVSGSTGSWGQTLVKKLLELYNVEQIICFSRGENAQVEMRRNFNNPKLKFVLGDVRDYEALEQATVGVDYIFHLAALKHIELCEAQPLETLKTNVDGTKNLIKAATKNCVRKVINVSSDKAVLPINLYGMSKAVAEKLIINANTKHTKFVNIRGGNVMGSNGSAIPFFINQIKSGNPVTITDLNMTRFFMSLDEAITLLFKASIDSIGGETFVLNMKSCKILDLVEVLIGNFAEQNIEIKEIGMRPGEKLHEMLVSEHDSKLTYCYDNNYYLTIPSTYSEELWTRYSDKQKFDQIEFSSNTKLMSKNEITDMIKYAGFIK